MRRCGRLTLIKPRAARRRQCEETRQARRRHEVAAGCGRWARTTNTSATTPTSAQSAAAPASSRRSADGHGRRGAGADRRRRAVAGAGRRGDDHARRALGLRFPDRRRRRVRREQGGIISAGGVGFDISCGIRCLRTSVMLERLARKTKALADGLFVSIPAGLGRDGHLHVGPETLDRILVGGAQWTVEHGYDSGEDLVCIEDHGRADGADPAQVSAQAKARQLREMGTLGSGNH
ncbi:MAG TPA: RtcB family protein, partial [Mizugakiibacter sp.]